jgi:three-Cys-motif partner protein
VTRRSKYFSTFSDHTLLKHAILRSYLQAWAFKLLQWGGAGSTVFFVDGFAGAGQDSRGNPGSPVIAATIAEQIRGHFRTAGGALRVIAVEANINNYNQLVPMLERFNDADPDCTRILLGSVSDQIGRITAEIGFAPALFFLDPFGLKGLEATSYPSMLKGDHNEILALFSDVGAIRLRGLVHSTADVAPQLESLRLSPSLFPELDEQATQELERKAKRHKQWIDQLQPAARAAISNALGESNWINELRASLSEEARTELIRRFVQRLLDSGAKHVLVIPMRGATGIRKYCLVHASKSVKAYTTMKEAVSQNLNKSDVPDEMRERIRRDLTVPMSQVWQLLLSRFGGQTVRWSDPIGGSVRGLLLEETVAFNFQCPEIKEELRQRGLLRRMNRLEMCVFPRTEG